MGKRGLKRKKWICVRSSIINPFYKSGGIADRIGKSRNEQSLSCGDGEEEGTSRKMRTFLMIVVLLFVMIQVSKAQCNSTLQKANIPTLGNTATCADGEFEEMNACLG
jgi:hypothetical protein